MPPPAPSPRPKTRRQMKAGKALGALAQTLGGEERQILEAAMRMAEGVAAGKFASAAGKKKPAAPALKNLFGQHASEEALANSLAESGDKPDTRATFCLVLKVDWDDEDRMVTFRDGRVAEYRVGY